MIVVFGSINLDLVARVTRLPRPGETVTGEAFASYPGGKGANQALAARRAGAEVVLVGAVGTDGFAAAALRLLQDAAVDLTRVYRVDAPTGIALIHVESSGENCITIVAGANASVDAAWVPDEILAPGATVVLQLEVALPAVHTLAARAHARGARTILNAAPSHALPADLLESLDALIVNETEATAIAAALPAPGVPEDFAGALQRRFGCATIVTLGAQGAVMAVDGTLIRATAPPLQVVDTTGAGDAFTGALAAALDRGATWPHALAAAVAAGSLACTVVGAQPALPTWQDSARLATTIEGRLTVHPLD